MRSFNVYYTICFVFCQVFVTSFLKVFLRKFFVVLSCLIHPWVGVVSIRAFVFGGVSGFCWVCDRGFSLLRPLASRVWGCGLGLGCLCGVGSVGALGGLLGVWGESRCGGLRLCAGCV